MRLCVVLLQIATYLVALEIRGKIRLTLIIATFSVGAEMRSSKDPTAFGSLSEDSCSLLKVVYVCVECTYHFISISCPVIQNVFWWWWRWSAHHGGIGQVQDSRHGQSRQPKYSYHREGSNRLPIVHSYGGELREESSGNTIRK